MKTSFDQLALFGATPVFETPLFVGRPNIGDRARFLERVNDMLDRRWLTNNGIYVQQFEQMVVEKVGVKHCIAICNATIALEIMVRAAGITGEVIVPSYTFVATAHALQWQQITPVFCDVDPETHTIDPTRIEELITPRTSAIMGVHVWGTPCDITALETIARRHKLQLFFDAAHAFGCTHRGIPIGSFGVAEVFSFHATKFVNAFEGGAVVTNDDELAQRMRHMLNFGFVDYDTVVSVGTNGKMSEVAAAMGITSLESLDDFIALNHHNYLRYQTALGDLPGVRFYTYDQGERQNYQYIVLEIDEALAGISRDTLHKILWAENVHARRYFYPGVHRMEPYRSYFPQAKLLLPHTEALCTRALQLPNGTSVDDSTIDMICQIIRIAIEQSAGITQRLSQ